MGVELERGQEGALLVQPVWGWIRWSWVGISPVGRLFFTRGLLRSTGAGKQAHSPLPLDCSNWSGLPACSWSRRPGPVPERGSPLRPNSVGEVLSVAPAVLSPTPARGLETLDK